MLTNTLPDVTSHSNVDTPLPLQWVGMEGVAIPVSIDMQMGKLQTVVAKADIYVNIEQAQAKGIHMSRLHLLVNKLAEIECNKASIESLLNAMIHSQPGISGEAKIKLAFEVLLKKAALTSGESGYQSYPITISAQKNKNGFLYEFELTIPYSSTCPCSASLARKAYSDAINQAFPDLKIDKTELLKWAESDAGSVATPHSQRSYAYIRLSVGDGEWPDIPQFIFQLESVIGTPVQAAVKRSDEQEFARLNASNLMFCEDAARRVKKSLEQTEFVKDYWFKIEHQESLHAHNAIVIDQRTLL